MVSPFLFDFRLGGANSLHLETLGEKSRFSITLRQSKNHRLSSQP